MFNLTLSSWLQAVLLSVLCSGLAIAQDSELKAVNPAALYYSGYYPGTGQGGYIRLDYQFFQATIRDSGATSQDTTTPTPDLATSATTPWTTTATTFWPGASGPWPPPWPLPPRRPAWPRAPSTTSRTRWATSTTATPTSTPPSRRWETD